MFLQRRSFMTFFICFFMFTGQNLENIDLYFPIFKNAACVGKDGSVFVLDRDKYWIYLFGKDGTFLRKFGGQGAGPGELQSPNKIYVLDQILYVNDANYSNIYRFNGSFLKKVKNPEPYTTLHKVPRGWLVLPRSGYEMFFQKLPIVLYNDDFTKKEVLMTLEKGNQPKNDHNTFYFNPVGKDIAKIVISKDQRHLYLRQPGTAQIHIYNFEAARFEKTIKMTLKRLPVDKEENEEKYKKFKASRKTIHIPIKLYLPDYHPFILSILARPDGGILVFTGGPEKKRFAFDAKGKSIPVTYLYFYERFDIGRILGVENGMAYISVYDGDMPGIHKVPFSKALVKIRKTPFLIEDYISRNR